MVEIETEYIQQSQLGAVVVGGGGGGLSLR